MTSQYTKSQRMAWNLFIVKMFIISIIHTGIVFSVDVVSAPTILFISRNKEQTMMLPLLVFTATSPLQTVPSMVDSKIGLKHVHHVKLRIMLERKERLEHENISLCCLVQLVLSWKNIIYQPLMHTHTTDLIFKSWVRVSVVHYDIWHSYQKHKTLRQYGITQSGSMQHSIKRSNQNILETVVVYQSRAVLWKWWWTFKRVNQNSNFIRIFWTNHVRMHVPQWHTWRF